MTVKLRTVSPAGAHHASHKPGEARMLRSARAMAQGCRSLSDDKKLKSNAAR